MDFAQELDVSKEYQDDRVEEPTLEDDIGISFALDHPSRSRKSSSFYYSSNWFSRIFDDLVSISFSQPFPSPGIGFEELAGLQTLECGIVLIDQSSTTMTSLSSQMPLTPHQEKLPKQGGSAI